MFEDTNMLSTRARFLRFLIAAAIGLTFTVVSAPDAEAKLAFFRNYPDLNWRVIKTEHFNVFYPVSKHPETSKHPVNGEFTARKTAFIAEEMYPLICGQFNYYLDETVNIVMLDQTDSLTGYTVPNFDWIVVSARHSDYLWRLRGHHDWLRNVMYHEFAHVVSLKADQVFAEESFGVVVSASWNSGKNIKPAGAPDNAPPLSGANVSAGAFFGTGDPWFWVEGGAEYYTDVAGINTWTANRDMRMRMDILEGTALNFDDMADYQGSNGGFDGNRHYLSGYSFALYLEERFGEGVYQSFALKRAEQGWSPNWLNVIEDTLNISADDLYADWQSWAKEKYSKVEETVMADPAIGGPASLGLRYWEDADPAGRERAQWVRTLDGGDKYKWRADRERDGMYQFAPRVAPGGEKYGWLAGRTIEIHEHGEDELLPFNPQAVPKRLEDPVDAAWIEKTVGWRIPSMGDSNFDFSPDGKKVVFACDEKYRYRKIDGKMPEFSERAVNADGYNWHTLCVWDFAKQKERALGLYEKFWGDDDPMADAEERYQKLLRGLPAKKPKKAKGKKARTHWMDWVGIDDVYEFDPVPGNHRRIQDPSWSPDGRTIAVSKYNDGTQNLWVVDMETGEGKALTNFTDGTRIESIDWSPDGSEIVFGSYRWNQNDIYVIGKDGANFRPITKDKFEDREPNWGDDGMIYFSSDRVGAIFNIFRINPALTAGVADADLDGIPDATDSCPTEPETVNLYKDTDGCPDDIPVRATADRIELDEKIFFELDKAVIKEESHELLNAVARVLLENPQVLKVEIGGHTDSQGKDDYNLDLSQRRSEAVLAYLTDQGVAADRLEAKGFGAGTPLRDLRAELRQIKDKEEKLRVEQEIYGANRRVEMLIKAQERVTSEISPGEKAGFEDADAGCGQDSEAKRLENAYLVQLTNVVGGAFTPSVTPKGHLFYSNYTAYGWKPWGLHCKEFFNKVVDDTSLVIASEDYGVDVPQEVYPDFSLVTQDVKVHGVWLRNGALIPIIDVGNVSLTHIGVNFGFQFWISDALDTNEFMLVGFAGEDLMLYGRYANKSLFPEFYLGGLIRKIKFDYGFNRDDDGSNTTTDDQFLADIKAGYLVGGGFAGVTFPISSWVSLDISTFQIGVAYLGVAEGKKPRPVRHRGNQSVTFSIQSAGLRGGRERINPRGGWSLSLGWSPSFTIPLNTASAGVDVDDGQVFESYFYNAFELSWINYIKMPWKSLKSGSDLDHTLQIELQLGVIDRNVPYADEIRGGGGGGSINTSNPYARNANFTGYEPFSLSGESVAMLNLQYRFPLARQIDKKVGPIYFESVYMQVFTTIGNFWSYALDDSARTTNLFGERVLADEEDRVGGGLDRPGTGIKREYPGMLASENGNYVLVDSGVEVRVAAMLFNRSQWHSFFRISQGWMPVSGRGDVDGDDVYTNSSDPTLNTQSDEREPAGFRFYLGIGSRW
jgi:outer membrane protein OmpA-like peptidoglycan-associated protein